MMKRLMTGVAAVALAMGGMALFGAFSAEAASTPTITITPNTGLTDMQQVQVTGTGFAPNLGAFSTVALECITTATTSAGCDINVSDIAFVTTDANGNLTNALGSPGIAFTVRTGTIGSGTCGTSATDATCKISIGTVATGVALTTGPITFASGGTTTTTTPTTTTTTPTTTTTTPTTTTTTPTTTTTTPRPVPRATRTTGTAVRGKTVLVTVWGSHFTAVSRVSGPAGATITVKSVTASKLTLKIKEAANARKGTFTLTIHFKSGKTASVKYTVR